MDPGAIATMCNISFSGSAGSQAATEGGSNLSVEQAQAHGDRVSQPSPTSTTEDAVQIPPQYVIYHHHRHVLTVNATARIVEHIRGLAQCYCFSSRGIIRICRQRDLRLESVIVCI
eukprot:jgi/Ulvmu1/2409/UM133_0010.1